MYGDPRNDPNNYKYWAIMLSKESIDYKDVYNHIKTLPGVLRIGVWLKLLKYQIKPELPSMVESDSELIKKIVYFSLKMDYGEPETLFNIYKTIERHISEINHDIIPFIILIGKMRGATEENVSSIIVNLMNNYGLLSYCDGEGDGEGGENGEGEGDKEGEKGDKKETSDRDNEKRMSDGGDNEKRTNDGDKEDASNHNEPDNTIDSNHNNTLNSNSNNTGHREATGIILKSSGKTKKSIKGDLSPGTVMEIWNILLKERNELFIPITDIVITLGCSYEDLFNRAREISLFEEPNKIISVAGALNNLCYYESLIRREHREPKIRKERNYFDFLIVQNEMIKAQESMREEYEEKLLRLANERVDGDDDK